MNSIFIITKVLQQNKVMWFLIIINTNLLNIFFSISNETFRPSESESDVSQNFISKRDSIANPNGTTKAKSVQFPGGHCVSMGKFCNYPDRPNHFMPTGDLYIGKK